jgi:hypothetical protein
MTDQYTSLSLGALKEILGGVRETLAIFARHRHPLASSEEDVRTKLLALERQLEKHIEHHPERRR